MMQWLLIFLLHFLPYNQQSSNDSIVMLSSPETIVTQGKPTVIHVYVTVKKGFHIQANTATDEFVIPTTLEINTRNILATGKQQFPLPQKFNLEGTSSYLMVYDGNFRISIPCKTEGNIQKGRYALNALLHYQACDNKTCFSPKTINFTIEVNVQ